MQTKQVICVREDMGAYDAARVSHIRHITEWKASGQPKICLFTCGLCHRRRWINKTATR